MCMYNKGIGEYHLKPEYLHLRKDIQDLELVQALSIDELLQLMRQTETVYHSKPTIYEAVHVLWN